jgi:hypothetical protein
VARLHNFYTSSTSLNSLKSLNSKTPILRCLNVTGKNKLVSSYKLFSIFLIDFINSKIKSHGNLFGDSQADSCSLTDGKVKERGVRQITNGGREQASRLFSRLRKRA